VSHDAHLSGLSALFIVLHVPHRHSPSLGANIEARDPPPPPLTGAGAGADPAAGAAALPKPNVKPPAPPAAGAAAPPPALGLAFGFGVSHDAHLSGLSALFIVLHVPHRHSPSLGANIEARDPPPPPLTGAGAGADPDAGGAVGGVPRAGVPLPCAEPNDFAALPPAWVPSETRLLSAGLGLGCVGGLPRMECAGLPPRLPGGRGDQAGTWRLALKALIGRGAATCDR